jgi:protein gp37
LAIWRDALQSNRAATLGQRDCSDTGYSNVWLGTTIEDNRVIARANHLRKIPAVVRFVSYEPAIGPLDKLDLAGIDWLIFGGESGPGYRPMDVQWARDIRDRCEAAGTAFFFKQSAGIRTGMGETLDGEIVRKYPVGSGLQPLAVRNIPIA